MTTFAVSDNIDGLAIKVRDAGEGVQVLRLDHHTKEIQDWLSAANPTINYANALGKRHKGTGLWFTGSQAFTDWRKQSNSLLWLYGVPGCGKTVLSSTIIEHLSNVTRPDQVLLYFYFDFNDTNKQTLDNLLRSLLNQLYQRQPDTRRTLDRLWESTRGGIQHLSKTLLSDVLLVILRKLNDFSIVLDALDESTTRYDVLAWLRNVLEAKCFACRILVTGRREEDIESALQRWIRPQYRISIRRHDINKDIRAYVGHTVRNSEELVRWHQMPKVQDEIETELVDRADGM